MRCGAGHCGNLDHEPGERFAFVSLSDVDRSLAAILLFYLTGWRSRRHGGSQANDVCYDRMVGAGSGRLGPLRLAQADQSVRSFGGVKKVLDLPVEEAVCGKGLDDGEQVLPTRWRSGELPNREAELRVGGNHTAPAGFCWSG